jgi:hypothetical protein
MNSPWPSRPGSAEWHYAAHRIVSPWRRAREGGKRCTSRTTWRSLRSTSQITPWRLTSENTASTTFVNKGKKRRGQGLYVLARSQ